jgi:alkanesulfonate monooxygenase SsuD/methylene tetrahydromethanopterin reductase-like flavin-dependent oxidoreductase (luciferase family)
VLLAKQLATVDTISQGRLRVGIAVGPRVDDYEATGSSFRERGRNFEAQLAELQAVWAQRPRGDAGPVGPAPVQAGGPPLLIGFTSAADIGFRRMADFGAGWIMGVGSPEARRAWNGAHRAGVPHLAALAYVSLGDDAVGHARRYLGDYYGFLGRSAEQKVAGALTSPGEVADAVAAFTDAGCDELMLIPCNPDLAQVSLTACAAGL